MSHYQKLTTLISEAALLSSTASTLSWDQETYLPKSAVPYRAQQLSMLSGKAHGILTSSEYAETLEQAGHENALSPTQEANLREWRFEHSRNTKLSVDFIQKESKACALSQAAWEEARSESDFSLFAPHLQTLVDLAKKKADLFGYQDEPYDALLESYERAATTKEVSLLFETLQPALRDLAAEAAKRSTEINAPSLQGPAPLEKQKQLNREIAESLGFDFSAGRIDTTAHPFCTTLGPRDIRLTTRYDEQDFSSSLFGVLHEVGHGLYEQGLPVEEFGHPAGTAVSLGIHESQSRLWENHVGRSEAFWRRWFPRACDLFPHLKKLHFEAFMQSINRAQYSLIRVEADEATYDLHILLRFKLERELLNGELEVKDIPQRWNETFENLFGMTPQNDAEGCLQDIHWSMGGLGYFPTYSLGNLCAAQLFNAAMKKSEISAAFDQAEYHPLLQWLRQEVHQAGSRYLPQDLMQRATGETMQAKAHLEHLQNRFL